MSRSRDPLALTPHWHVDFRLEAELPEDNIVGKRFLINVLFSALALAALLFTGWLGYVTTSLRYQIRDWEQRIKENQAEVHDIQRMQREYAEESAKIDQAHALIAPHFFVSGLIAQLGRDRPEPLVIDIIEWNDSGVVIRGNVRANSERATNLVGDYVKVLRKDEKIAALFREINLSDVDRGASGDLFKFEILLKPKVPKS